MSRSRPTLAGLALRARLRAASLVGPRPRVSTQGYYPQQPSCQIPNIWFLLELYLGPRDDGTFVEVGAYDGVAYSNTWGLAARGWTGLLVEPIAQSAARARAAHAGHRAITVVLTAVGAHAGVLQVRVAGEFTSASRTRIEDFHAVSYRSVSPPVAVPVVTLDSLIADHLPGAELDLLVVDVEGYEPEVFAGFSWRVRPLMLIVELMDLAPVNSLPRGPITDIREAIIARGYRVVYLDHMNTVFVREDAWAAGQQRLAAM